MNGYELSRDWFDFRFENPSKVRSIHTELYLYIVDQWNRLYQKKEIGLPTKFTMDSLGIGSYNTFKNALLDLVEWGFIVIVKDSHNQHQSKIIALSKSDKPIDKPIDKPSNKPTDTIKELTNLINKETVLHPLQTWIKENCERVSRLKKQLTYEEAEKLVKDFDKDLLKTTLMAMENRKTLNYISVNLTLRAWLKNEISIIGRTSELTKISFQK